eukprot:scaffold32271_cov21-Tisochrysis_lutea.AAC.1
MLHGTAARIHLNSHNPAWLQGLATAVPEANWKLLSVGNHSTLHTIHADMPEFIKYEHLGVSDKQENSRNLTNPHIDNQKGGLAPDQYNTALALKVPDWRT